MVAFKALAIFAAILSASFFNTKAEAYSSLPPVPQTIVANHSIGQIEVGSHGYAGPMFYTAGESFSAISASMETRGDPSLYPFVIVIRNGSFSSTTPLGSVIATSSIVYGSSVYNNRYATSSTDQTYTVFPFSSTITLPAGYYFLQFMRNDWPSADSTNFVTTRKLVATSTYNRIDVWSARVSLTDVPNQQWFSSDNLWFTGSTTPPAYTPVQDPDYVVNTTTRIVDFAPADGAELPPPTVKFSLHAYVNPEDIGTFIGVRFTLQNIDQNVFLLSGLSPATFFLLDGFDATSSGDFYYQSASTTLAEGNYMVSATLERSYVGGWLVNPFSPINETRTHQFVIGSSSFIGNIQQKAFSDLQTFFASSTATSTAATSRDCNPLAFDVKNCMAYLLIPSTKDLQNTILGVKDQILVRIPWGYPTRFYSILTSGVTTTLPSFSVNLHLGSNATTSTSTLTFSPDDMLTGGAALASSITDVTYGKTMREITEPLVQGGIALLVLFIIVGDMLGGSMNHGETAQRTGQQKQAAVTRREYNF